MVKQCLSKLVSSVRPSRVVRRVLASVLSVRPVSFKELEKAFKPGVKLNGVFRFVFDGFGGPGGGFGGFPVGSKSSGKATTTTTK